MVRGYDVNDMRMANLHALFGKVALDTEVQACLSFGHEVHTSMSGCIVRDKASHYGCLAHFTLLKTLPAVRMRQNEFDAVLDR